MAEQLTQAGERLERLLLEALGPRHDAILDWAVIRFAIRDAQRYRWWRVYAMQGDDLTADDAFLDCETPEEVDAVVDAALARLVGGQQCDK